MSPLLGYALPALLLSLLCLAGVVLVARRLDERVPPAPHEAPAPAERPDEAVRHPPAPALRQRGPVTGLALLDPNTVAVATCHTHLNQTPAQRAEAHVGVWAVDEGKRLRWLPHPATSIASAPGALVLGERRTVRCVDPVTGAVRWQRAVEGQVSGVAAGARAVVGLAWEGALVWWSRAGKELARSSHERGMAVAISAHGRVATVGGDGVLRLWGRPGVCDATVQLAQPTEIALMSVAWSDDGQRLIVGGAEGEVWLVDGNAHEVQGPLDGLRDRITAVGFTADGAAFAAASHVGGRVLVDDRRSGGLAWWSAAGARLGRVNVGGAVRAAVADGRGGVLALDHFGQVRRWSLPLPPQLAARPYALGLSADGRRLATLSAADGVRLAVHALDALAPVSEASLRFLRECAFSPDLAEVAVYEGEAGCPVIRGTAEGEERRRLEALPGYEPVVWTARGLLCAAPEEDSPRSLALCTAEGEVVRSVDFGGGGSAALLADGRVLQASNNLVEWEARGGGLARWVSDGGGGRVLAVSPTEPRALLAREERVMLVDLDRREVVWKRPLPSHPMLPPSVCAAWDGELVALGIDRRLLVLEAGTGAVRADHLAHVCAIAAVRAGGGRAITVGMDGELALWPLG